MEKVAQNSYEVAVVGAGPAGLACALGLAQGGLKTVVLAGPHRPSGGVSDQRTAALFGCSIDLLKNLGVFRACRPVSAKICGIRIIDDTERILRAPEVLFSAQDVGVEQFGFNVPQGELVKLLRAQAGAVGDRLSVVETKGVVSVTPDDEKVVLKTAEGAEFCAQIVAAGDGRNSVCRSGAGISVKTRRYEQSALALTFGHQRDHRNISTELHRRSGPFTVVPMPGRRSSLVWVERSLVAERLMEMPLDKFQKVLETRLQGLLGGVSDIGPRVLFPLTSMAASEMARRRVVLIGEAGHVMAPIGAQGLNLSLRDGAALVDLVVDAKATGRDLGGDDIMAAYQKARRFDVFGRVGMVDLLNRSLVSSFEPVQMLRGAGLTALKMMGPLRRFVILQGLGPQSGLPRMMRTPSPPSSGSSGAAAGC